MRTPLALLTEDACSNKCFKPRAKLLSWTKQEESVLIVNFYGSLAALTRSLVQPHQGTVPMQVDPRFLKIGTFCCSVAFAFLCKKNLFFVFQRPVLDGRTSVELNSVN